MRGMRVTGYGMDCWVRGMKESSGWEASSWSSRLVGRVDVESEGCVVVNVDCGAGAVEGRTEGLGSGGSSDVERSGKAGCEAGVGNITSGARLSVFSFRMLTGASCSTSGSGCRLILCSGKPCSVGPS
jgi:hypothetical protein